MDEGRGGAREKGGNVASPRNISVVWVWALLAVLLCYSFDLECLIEEQGCAQTILHSERPSDCTQPGIKPSPVPLAILTTPPRFCLPAWREATLVAVSWAVSASPPPAPRSVPLGLRAPPVG